MSDLNTDEGTVKEALHPPPTYSAASRAIMGQKSKTSVQAIRKQVDQRIDQLEDEIRALKTHRNMVSNTSALPPEVLSSIFIILRGLTGTSTGCYYYVSAAPWARVTHVCRHWRAVALDCPALWSDLLFVSPTTTAMMLQRSKNAPLTVKFAANPVLYQDILCGIMSQTGRLRELELRSSSSSTRIDFLEVLASLTTAPILEKLVLGGATVSEPRLPEDFLQDGAPSLRHLELTQFAVRWDSLPLSSTLVHLRLQNITSYRPLRKAFLESMPKMLRLETLKLSACLPQSGDVSHPSRSLPISLPSLRILELQDSVAELCQFFRAAQIPREAKVLIEASDANTQSETLELLFSALKASWTLRQDTGLVADSSLAQSEILDLRIVGSGYYFSEVKCWFKDHELPPIAHDDNPPANLAVSVPTASNNRNPAVHTPLLTAIAQGFDISSLRTLKIASKTSMPDEAFALFKDLTKLDAIAISTNHYNLTRFLQALKKEGASPGTPSFPALSSIHLHFIDFDEMQVGNANTTVCNLIKDLKHREESCPISELSITQCINFSMAHWAVLSGSLREDVEVDWDKDEKILEPDSEDEYNCPGIDWYDEEVWSGMYDDYW